MNPRPSFLGPNPPCSRRYRVGLTICVLYLISLSLLWAAGILQDVVPVADLHRWSVALFTMGLFGYVRFLVLAFSLATKPSIALSNASLPSYPLAVKSPYLSTWLPSDETSDVATGQPQFWAGQELTWPVLARVNGTTYALLNAPSGLTSDITHATTERISYTSTHTYIVLSAGCVTFVLDFFSPVYPSAKDYALQSLPYSYLTVNVTASGYGTSSVQVFTAIDYSWTAQGGASDLNFTTTDDVGFFWFYNPDQIRYTESSDQATWGSVLFGSVSSNATTYGCDSANNIYSTFASNGELEGSAGYASTGCSGTDLAGLTEDLGNVGSAGAAATFAVGFQRDLAIQYLGEAQTGYHRTQWYEIPDAVDFFLGNYDTARTYSLSFDSLVRSKAESVSSEFGSQYADILEASVRQSFAAYELTVPNNDLNASVSAFLKEISSDGNVNTIDLIFQSWPIFISLNPEYIILVLKPVLSYIASGRWPLEYVIHDIGTHYPNATGHDDGNEEHMPLFETSSLLILLYAYQEFTGDTSFTERYSSLLDGYAQYLVANTLYPASQLISVDAIAATANQTGLAIQSAIGLNAAAALLGNDTYGEYAESFAHTIYEDALGLNAQTLNASAHFTYNYGDSDTWNVLFPAYADVILNLTTFPQGAWDLQSDWYLEQITDYGLAFAGPESDRGVNWALTDWNFEWAAIAPSELQTKIVNTTHTFLTNDINTIPFGTKYYVQGTDAGKWIANKARGTVGTHFAIVALQQGTWSL